MNQEKTVYWNNVCLLSKMEEENNNRYLHHHKTHSDFSIHFIYFGLGREQTLYNRMREDLSTGRPIPDGLVSTDLSIFHDSRCLLKQSESFAKIDHFFPIRSDYIDHPIMHPKGKWIPSNIIPLVMVINRTLVEEGEVPTSFESLLSDKWNGKVVLGGIDTSAGKSVLMAYWYLFGKTAVDKLIENVRFSTVPAQAFQLAKSGFYPIAIVPTIFSAMGDRFGLKQIWPDEGAVCIPAYVGVRKDVPDSIPKLLGNCLFNDRIQKTYSRQGQMIPMKEGILDPDIVRENKGKILYPSWEWIETFDMDEFLDVSNRVRMHGCNDNECES